MAVSSAQVFQQDDCSPLPFGGYDDAMFIDPPDANSGLLCPVCWLILREPHLLSCCGKHLCRVCILKVKNGGKPCPCCNGVEFVTMLDKGKNASVLSLKMYCTNKDGGCQWTGELGDSSRHLKERCDYVLEDCPFACGQTLPRHSMEKHKAWQCIKRPIEVQLECLSQDMGERLRMLELKYEDKMAVLEGNIVTLETTIHEQEKKIEEQEKKMEEQEKKMEEQERKIKEQEKKMEEQEKTMEEQRKEMEELKTKIEEQDKKMEEQEKKMEEQKKKIEKQEKKRNEQEKKMEEQLLEQAEHHKQQLEEQKFKFDEKIAIIETKMTQQVVQQAEREERKLAMQEKRLTKAEGVLTAQSKELKTVQQEKWKHQLKLTEHEKQLVSVVNHDKQLNKLKKQNEKLYSDIQKQQARMEQAEEKSTKQFASLEGSSTSCKDELQRVDQQLKEVDAKLSCEVVIPVPTEKAKFICKGQLWKQIFSNRDDDDVIVESCLNDPNNPAIKLQIIPLEKKLAKRKSEISELVSSVIVETISFQPEQLMVYQFLFESAAGRGLGVPYSNSRLEVKFEKERCTVYIVGTDCAAVKDAKSRVSELVLLVVVETVLFPPEKTEIFKYLFEGKGQTVIKKLQKSFSVEISTKGNHTTEIGFTVQIVGVSHDVKKTSSQLVDFKENHPVTEEVKFQSRRQAFQEIKEYAHSKSVIISGGLPLMSLGGRTREINQMATLISITLKGGKHDITQVKDYIFEKCKDWN